MNFDAKIARNFVPSESLPKSVQLVFAESYRGLAVIIHEQVEDGREKAIALTKLEESMMWATAGVERNRRD